VKRTTETDTAAQIFSASTLLFNSDYLGYGYGLLFEHVGRVLAVEFLTLTWNGLVSANQQQHRDEEQESRRRRRVFLL